MTPAKASAKQMIDAHQKTTNDPKALIDSGKVKAIAARACPMRRNHSTNSRALSEAKRLKTL